MKAELKQKWIEALRSGAYEQGRTELKSTSDGKTKHCCLGVLRECAGLPWESRGTNVHSFLPPIDLDAGGYLHQNECESLGLQPDIANELVKLNDGLYEREKHSFDQIADFIEANVPAA